MRRASLLPPAALLLALAASPGLLAQRPSGTWRTIETAHARIHHRAEFGPWAARLASRIESIHERVTAYVGYDRKGKFDVVVTDPAAEANGMALPFLDRPYMVLWTTPPDSESVIGNDRDWTELLALHEDTHLVHLLRPKRHGSAVADFLLPLGPLTLRCPRWATEGYATLVEGALTGSGRPHGAFRAMVIRRRAMDGQLPTYAGLNATDGFQAGSMAYLVGSAYLEWLEDRQGDGSLVRLWKRLAGRDHPSFERAFQGVFGEAPDVLYARFGAEVTAQALAAESAWKALGLEDGEKWQRLTGETRGLSVSKDGTLLAAVRRHGAEGTRVDVWTVEPTAEERKARERADAKVAQRTKDPEEVADVPATPRPRTPKWTLRARNGFAPSAPRFLPDGRLLLVRKGPDGEGILHADLWTWDPRTGEERRVTRLADVREADASPDGRWALGTRSRFGATGPVRVDLASGEVAPLLPPSVDETWTAPRLSPDGVTAYFTVHRGGRWRLLRSQVGATLRPSEVDLGDGSPVGAVSFSPAGDRFALAVAREGVWNVEEFPAAGGAGTLRTRVRGGALSPAFAPDGSALFFLEVVSRGIDVQRLAASAPPAARRSVAGFSSPVVPLAPRAGREAAPPEERPVPAPRPYSPMDTMRLSLGAGTTVGPAGFSQQVGVAGDDLLGRLRWQLLGGLADDSGEKGGSAAVAWRSHPVELRAQLFTVSQHVSNERIVQPTAYDRDRGGLSVDARWERLYDAVELGARAGAVTARVSPDGGDPFTRTLGAAGFDVKVRRSSGRWGFAAALTADGSAGRTDGRDWTSLVGAASLTLGTPVLGLTVRGGAGTTGSSPTTEDLFRVGSMATSLTPPVLDLNRVAAPALPEAFQTGRSVRYARAEVHPAKVPYLVLYGELFHAWDDVTGQTNPVARLTGAEFRLSSRDLPVDLGGDLTILLGVARLHGDVPGSGTNVGYAAFVVRP